MATHSSIRAWRIPWTEEPAGLTSMGSESRTQLSNQHTFLKEKREQIEGTFSFLSSPNGLSWEWEADVMQPRGETDHYARNRKRRQNESTVFNAFPQTGLLDSKGKAGQFSSPTQGGGRGRVIGLGAARGMGRGRVRVGRGCWVDWTWAGAYHGAPLEAEPTALHLRPFQELQELFTGRAE